jgi:hypothetical protein
MRFSVISGTDSASVSDTGSVPADDSAGETVSGSTDGVSGFASDPFVISANVPAVPFASVLSDGFFLPVNVKTTVKQAKSIRMTAIMVYAIFLGLRKSELKFILKPAFMFGYACCRIIFCSVSIYYISTRFIFQAKKPNKTNKYFDLKENE